MFYSQFILAKKGPLGTIWIAAHLERKLRKNQVADTDIGVSVDSILFPEMPIALRLSSHLLLGVVRIYSRKVNYLFDDCSEALLKVKQAFRSTAVDLPPEESTAPYHSITLPETFDLDDFELPDNENFQGNYVDHHISSKDQITLQDTMEGVVYSTSKFGLDERFGDGDASGLDLDEELLVEKAAAAEHATGSSNSEYAFPPLSVISLNDPKLQGSNINAFFNLSFDPQASIQANTSLKYEDGRDAQAVPEAMPASGIVNQQIGEYDGDNEPVEYAQAPCTPGLWEEPNLSNIQDTSACDDHHEPENHRLTEFAVKENLENASSKEAECLPHDEHHNLFEPQGKSLQNIASTGQMLMDDLGSTPFTESLSADQVRSTSPMANAPDAANDVSDDLVKAEDLFNKNARDEEPGVQAVNDNHENFVELQGMLLNYVTHVVMLPVGNQENTYHLITELESNTEAYGKDNLVSSQDQAFPDPKDSMISVQSPQYAMPSSDFPSLRPCTTLLNHSETSDKQLADNLQPSDFTSMFSHETSAGREDHPNASGDSVLVQGEGPHATEALERKLPEVHLAELGPNDEFQVASNLSNKQVDNVIEGEVQVDAINGCRLSDLPKDFVPESTPAEKEIATGDGGDASMFSGKKRSFTESSLTAQSLNLEESSGLFATNVTRESVMDDDDLLSSILVGRRSSVLKMKPTPPVKAPSAKRRRMTPKTGISKRKVLMDDNMVLHGDTIRQQLINTEDIRRLRKKAPCTRTEISMIEKQFWEDELFSEAVFTGVSMQMASLHNQLYDLSHIVVSHCDVSLEGGTDPKSVSRNDEMGMQLEAGTEEMGPPVEADIPKENGGDNNFNPVASEDVSEAQPIEFPMVADDRTCDNNTTNLDHHGSQAQMQVTGYEVLGQGTAMEIDAKSFSDANLGVSDIPIEVEFPTHADVVPGDTCDTSAALGEVDKTSQMDDFSQKDHSDEKMGIQTVDMDPCMDISTNIEGSVASEIKVDDAPVKEISEEEHEVVANASAMFSSETDGLRPHIGTLDEEDMETRKNEEEFVNKDDGTLALDAECNAHNLVCNGIYGEEFEAVPGYNGEVNPVLEDVSLDERENQGDQVTFPMPAMSVEDSTFDYRVDDNVSYLLDRISRVLSDLTYSAIENDTDDRCYKFVSRSLFISICMKTLISFVIVSSDFLNFDDVDDDDEAETAGDYMPDAEAPRVIDNSGWSSRTKNVAKYLQIMFDKEGARGRNSLPVNNLLAGKTRKEASRMFFETLVLKTKDYIHVEQRDPYENIDIFPRAKLLKSDF
ncbi:hypothetical protein OSB04_026711 [Centaurea solstitialis]|uniref:Sister chromatid cohesion 1 protein 4 n=1 Tax=Centaurea solstitialis TaxID=347529 RepID=A0AA38SPY4_9ASTR|nr:hypothetical protein OSB04_026711 [Centaurea solstitialis]